MHRHVLHGRMRERGLSRVNAGGRDRGLEFGRRRGRERQRRRHLGAACARAHRGVEI